MARCLLCMGEVRPQEADDNDDRAPAVPYVERAVVELPVGSVLCADCAWRLALAEFAKEARADGITKSWEQVPVDGGRFWTDAHLLLDMSLLPADRADKLRTKLLALKVEGTRPSGVPEAQVIPIWAPLGRDQLRKLLNTEVLHVGDDTRKRGTRYVEGDGIWFELPLGADLPFLMLGRQYVKFLCRTWPHCEFFADAADSRRAVRVYDGARQVAVIMPMRADAYSAQVGWTAATVTELYQHDAQAVYEQAREAVAV